jgi:putative transcriptional regulator
MSPSQIKRLRGRLKLSQSEFARMLGISTRTLQQWEQGVNKPRASALTLLQLADSDPQVFARKRGS